MPVHASVGLGSGLWKREDLEEVIKKHEGYIASSPELGLYVYPNNWDELRQAIRERHAASIIGQSGTGKTLAAQKLYEELRVEIPCLLEFRLQEARRAQRGHDGTSSSLRYRGSLGSIRLRPREAGLGTTSFLKVSLRRPMIASLLLRLALMSVNVPALWTQSSNGWFR